MKRIGFIFGTRPEIIKLAPIIRLLENSNLDIDLISTGQQLELNTGALRDHDLFPNFSLGLMKQNQSLNSFISSAISEISKLLEEKKYSAIVVHGDTGTTLAAALSAFNLHIPVFHVEAGLRSNDLNNPFPEEMNRRLVSQLSTLHFTPTARATMNLRKEGIPSDRILEVGNTIVDIVLDVLSQNKDRLESSIFVKKFKQFEKNILITVHRRENHAKMGELVKAIEFLATRFANVGFWIPVHPNPNVAVVLKPLANLAPNVMTLPPLDYFDLLAAMSNCNFIVTDSGGIQEESTVIKKYCLVLRDFTERPELIESHMGELVAFERQSIISTITRELDNPTAIISESSPFGDGKSSKRICEIIESFLIK